MPRIYSPGASAHDDFAHICDNCQAHDGRPSLGWTLPDGRYFDICLECLTQLTQEYCHSSFETQKLTSSTQSSTTKQPIPDALRWAVFERDNFTCQACGSRQYLTVDHVIPESLGGPTVFSNLQTLCKSCNSKKGVTGKPLH
ncbi:MAG: HNH endonuclease signature motif containing protein [bacterium]|nr:HNH endonuclease signature motif containing protein [bacterium]